MTTLLALDCAAASCSVAVYAEGAVRAKAFEPMATGQAEVLVPMVQSVMADAGLTYADLDVIAATQGPGSFTGLRVGLATARGLALAAGIGCLGLTTTEVLAEAAIANGIEGRILAVLDTRRADVYAQLFDDQTALSAPDAIPYDALAALVGTGPVTVVGDVAAQAAEGLNEAAVFNAAVLPDAIHVAARAARLYVPGMDLALPQPLYLKPPQATIPKHGGRLRP